MIIRLGMDQEQGQFFVQQVLILLTLISILPNKYLSRYFSNFSIFFILYTYNTSYILGGVMEAALRTGYEIVTGKEVPFKSLNITPVRGNKITL